LTDTHDAEISDHELTKVAEALKTITQSPSDIQQVKEEFDEFKKDRQDFIEDIEPSQQSRLSTTIDKMLFKIEKELNKYDQQTVKLNLIGSNSGEQKITIQQLEQTLKIIRDHPNDERISKIVKKIDSDNDGVVTINEILSVVSKNEKSKISLDHDQELSQGSIKSQDLKNSK
jgi:LETM1 and EF-hand domain-containing protein 1